MKLQGIYILLLLPFLACAQPVSDSLKNILRSNPGDTTLVKTLNALAWEIRFKNPDSSLLLNISALKEARKLSANQKYTTKLNVIREYTGLSLHQAAYTYYIKGVYDSSIRMNEAALAVWDSLLAVNAGEQILLRKANTLANAGITFSDQGNFNKAQEYYFKSLQTITQSPSVGGNEKNASPAQKLLIAKNYGNLGIVYRNLNNTEKALTYYFKALEIDKQLNKKTRIAADLGNIGNVYAQQKMNDKALEYYKQALEIDREAGNKKGLAINTGNIGLVYQDQKKYKEALAYFFDALKLRQELGDKNYIAIQLGNIGALYTLLKDYSLAEKYLLHAVALSDTLGILNEKMVFENHLSELYMIKKDYKKAYEHFRLYSSAKDSIFNADKQKELTRNELTYEFEKREAVSRAEQQKQAAIADARQTKQKLFSWLLGAIALAVAVIALVIFRALKITRVQKQIIEHKNVQITDSIAYAKSIQDAVLPPGETIKKHFPDSFILFLPKDIVSGDFYWMSPKQNHTFFAAVDCVGHGVPGAFMALHSYNLLEHITNELPGHNPAGILDELNKKVIASLNQQNQSAAVKHGMDMSLLKISRDKIEFAGARNPLVIVSPGSVVNEVKADRMYVGGAQGAFTNNETKVESGSMLYVFTDGYADQKGGPDNKKLFGAPLRSLLQEVAGMPTEEQKKKLEQFFENWKGSGEQIDDVLIAGIRV